MSNLSQGLDRLVFKKRRKTSYKIKREGFVVVRITWAVFSVVIINRCKKMKEKYRPWEGI